MNPDARPAHHVVGGGAPSVEEAVAIAVAVEALWPRPVAAAEAAVEAPSLRWRFSGRWWTRSTISRRDRPWVGPTR